jgi:hypothetical protein
LHYGTSEIVLFVKYRYGDQRLELGGVCKTHVKVEEYKVSVPKL